MLAAYLVCMAKVIKPELDINEYITALENT
jgi:hypothetical protein